MIRLKNKKKKILDLKILNSSKSYHLKRSSSPIRWSANLKGHPRLFPSFFKIVKLGGLMDLLLGIKNQSFELKVFFLKKKKTFFKKNGILFKTLLLKNGFKNFEATQSVTLKWVSFFLFNLYFISRLYLKYLTRFNLSWGYDSSSGSNFQKKTPKGGMKKCYSNKKDFIGKNDISKNYFYKRVRPFNKNYEYKYFLQKKGNLTHSIINTNFLFG